jgi:hypothetical protein
MLRRVDNPAFGQPKRERPVPDVACRERVHRVGQDDVERGNALDREPAGIRIECRIGKAAGVAEAKDAGAAIHWVGQENGPSILEGRRFHVKHSRPGIGGVFHVEQLGRIAAFA